MDALINACDAGREGELIFRNILKAAGVKKPLKRLWLQSMTPESIRSAFQNLRSDDDLQPLADAALSRSESDWLVGINATRALTAFNSQGGRLQQDHRRSRPDPHPRQSRRSRGKDPRLSAAPLLEVFGDFGVVAGSYRGRWFDAAFKKGAEEDRAERIWDQTKAEAIKAKCDRQPGTIEEEKKPTTPGRTAALRPHHPPA